MKYCSVYLLGFSIFLVLWAGFVLSLGVDKKIDPTKKRRPF